ncbi:ABC transporter permease [Pedobacter lusitanus]|uniref:ABC transporter permease n=1 Tax=Pedobacter lusitanus TaxID=1503925 RepID=UPI00069798DC|nr:ABC transporter permease [Pedobacter lusitanus]
MSRLKTFLSLTGREFRLFKNNPVMVMLFIGGPILYGIIFGAMYQKGKFTDLPVKVVDKDNSALSTRFIDMLNDMDVLKVVAVKHENVEMRTVLMNDKAMGAVIIPDGFEADILQNRHPEINAYVNNANLMTSSYVSRALLTAAGTLNAGIKIGAMQKQGLPGTVAADQYEAFHSNIFRLYNPASNYMIYSWPSYLAIILQTVTIVVMALSFTSEFEAGTFGQLCNQSKSVAMMMAIKVVPYWMISLVLAGILACFYVIFKEPFPQHIGDAAVIFCLFIAAATFMGMVASIIFKTQLRAVQFLMVLSMTVYIVSGYSWPFDQTGWAARLFAYVFPMMPFVNGYRILLLQNGTLGDIGDYTTILCIQLCFYALLSYVLLKIKVRGEIKK